MADGSRQIGVRVKTNIHPPSGAASRAEEPGSGSNKKKRRRRRCSYCGQLKADVRRRPDGYRNDVNNEPHATHVACDSCDHECNQDI